jgi:hypothetical protein
VCGSSSMTRDTYFVFVGAEALTCLDRDVVDAGKRRAGHGLGAEPASGALAVLAMRRGEVLAAPREAARRGSCRSARWVFVVR